MKESDITWITKGGTHIPIVDGKFGNKSANDYMNEKIRNKSKTKAKKEKTYSLDVENSWINYIPQTQKKYFKVALDYALKNKMDSVKVNRIEYHFDFDNMVVKIGTKNDLNTYKLK